MSLEELLKPVKYVDEQVLRGYTVVSKQLHLDEGRKKYFVGMGLCLTNFTISIASNASNMPYEGIYYSLTLLTVPDGALNCIGIMEALSEQDSETKAVNLVGYAYKKLNAAIRLPFLTAGIGLIGKFGVDLFNYLTKGEPMESNSYTYLYYGFGLLSVASSMYIKDTNPKILDKKPFYKAAYDWVKEPFTPTPEPVTTYSALEDKILRKTLSAAASSLGIGISDLETGAGQRINIINLCTL